MQSKDINESYNAFIEKINKELNNISPEKLVAIPHKSIFREPWMTKGLINSSKKKEINCTNYHYAKIIQINLMINTLYKYIQLTQKKS